MPVLESENKPWIDQMDSDDENEELSTERKVEIKGTNKIITEYTVVDGEKVKLVRHYKLEKRKVSKEAALRKTWAKFGSSTKDAAGPNLATTMIMDEIKMEFLSVKDNDDDDQNDGDQSIVKSLGNQVVQCRNCGLNHWTLQCPYKNQLNAINKMNENLEPSKGGDDKGRPRPGFSSFKDGKRLDMGTRGKDENNTIRITNLPEETQDSDIRDLFKDFGRITRIFLAKDKATGNSKGFAFVSFEMREHAARAIKTVHGHGYNNLILSVEWARPSGN